MGGQAEQESSTGPAFRVTRTTCPYFPSAGAMNAYSGAAKLEAAAAIFAGLASHPAVDAQSEALSRISFTRTHQKRGPPIFLS